MWDFCLVPVSFVLKLCQTLKQDFNDLSEAQGCVVVVPEKHLHLSVRTQLGVEGQPGRKFRKPTHRRSMAARRNELQQDSSESDSEPEPGSARPQCGPGAGPWHGSVPGRSSQVIHSGHFMVSSPHSDSTARRRKSGSSARYDFDTVNRTWCQTYWYHSGSLSIDPTLTRLFECMSLAYRWVPAPSAAGQIKEKLGLNRKKINKEKEMK